MTSSLVAAARDDREHHVSRLTFEKRLIRRSVPSIGSVDGSVDRYVDNQAIDQPPPRLPAGGISMTGRRRAEQSTEASANTSENDRHEEEISSSNLL
ncbi:hypothetical protein Q1695_011068 [Nippostrongylus brasiliensis]|nr:hypothetical protein Q1695_011068 [Nippostrongylus brasiliensis]